VSPGWEAVIEQAPPPVIDTVVPATAQTSGVVESKVTAATVTEVALTLQTEGVADTKLTASPELDCAPIMNGATP
jgi:hypothetical protein